MPKLKRLSGEQLIASLKDFGFAVAGQKGSHVKLARIVDGKKQTLTIPKHKKIDTGTLRAIYRQASAYVPETELKSRFFSE